MKEADTTIALCHLSVLHVSNPIRSSSSFPIKQITIGEALLRLNTITRAICILTSDHCGCFVTMLNATQLNCICSAVHSFIRIVAIPCNVRKTNGIKCKYSDYKQLTLYIQINVCAFLFRLLTLFLTHIVSFSLTPNSKQLHVRRAHKKDVCLYVSLQF